MQEKHHDPTGILRAIALRDLDTSQNMLMSLTSGRAGGGVARGLPHRLL